MSAAAWAPGTNKVVLRYSTAGHDVIMTFETVSAARSLASWDPVRQPSSRTRSRVN